MECFVSYQHQKSRIRINQLKTSILVKPMVFIKFNNFFWSFIDLKTPNTGKVMTQAKGAAQMTRGVADLVDTRGKDLLDLMGTFSSEGKIQ